jgi:tetratricopeptide (TPR) repeat protein
MEGAMYVRPMDLSGHEKLGVLLLRLKQYPSAAREYETLLALNTTDRAGAYYHLAEAKFGEGKQAEANKNVMESLKIAPSYGPALELLLKTLK